MKVLQLNIWAGRLQRDIPKLIKEEKPDIICLQEAISFERDDAGMFYTIENMQQCHDLPYVSMAPVFSFKLMNGIARFGNCILSCLPIQKSESVFTYMSHKEDFDFNEDSGNARNFIHAETIIGGTTYHVITHHGYHVPEHKNGNEETLRQMRQMREYIDSLDGPIILTGDFNLAPHSESLEIINQRLHNHSISGKLKTTRNQFTHKTEVCDYIFTNEKVKVKRFYASDALVSDHKALFLEFEA
ncbi:hypothetical protein BH23PAT1_BH23PAT1_1480 [soil metagenome]